MTPLQACIYSGLLDNNKMRGIKTAEMLIQNGAKTNTLNKSMLEKAMVDSSEKEMISYIKQRLL